METRPGIRCFRCGYELRADVLDQVCPECGTRNSELLEERRPFRAAPVGPWWIFALRNAGVGALGALILPAPLLVEHGAAFCSATVAGTVLLVYPAFAASDRVARTRPRGERRGAALRWGTLAYGAALVSASATVLVVLAIFG